MPKAGKESKLEPLTPKDVKRVLFERGDTIAGLVRAWNEEHPGLRATAWQLRAVIYRYPEVVYQTIRELLADYLGCEVSQVGRESPPKSIESEAAA
jgi:hypothetical protein